MSQYVAQILIVLMQVIGLLSLIYQDVNGRRSRPPAGFGGIVATIVLYALVALLYRAAGAYSTF